MNRGPTDAVRRAGNRARAQKRSDQIAELKIHIRTLLADVERGVLNQKSITPTSIYGERNIKRSTFYGWCKNDQELQDLYSAAVSPTTPYLEIIDDNVISAENSSTADKGKIDSLQFQVVSLKQQLIATNTFIGALELERVANQREIKSKTSGMKAAELKISKLGSMVHEMHLLLQQNGIDYEFNDAERVVELSVIHSGKHS